ncbi:MAG: hypothetical protein F6K23_33840 [Okeania sp. SIO2C9]|uniref:hypothetical protein n=1 Tax=Okeania sp. SIO2C9 TaxID=2607791 RepID=UPI0013C20476|nr:hypothetical protein [Okeania sp. SIO2C9]NEQ77561.1 hypothetical protein [Okeania sp. SIO2C9]
MHVIIKVNTGGGHHLTRAQRSFFSWLKNPALSRYAQRREYVKNEPAFEEVLAYGLALRE